MSQTHRQTGIITGQSQVILNQNITYSMNRNVDAIIITYFVAHLEFNNTSTIGNSMPKKEETISAYTHNLIFNSGAIWNILLCTTKSEAKLEFYSDKQWKLVVDKRKAYSQFLLKIMLTRVDNKYDIFFSCSLHHFHFMCLCVCVSVYSCL